MYDEKNINNNTKVNVEILDETDSTNEEAKRRIQSGFSKDFVLVAREQTKGKGRKGRSFYSPKDTGLYMTLAFLSILMTYFGVNYLLGGMHSYA